MINDAINNFTSRLVAKIGDRLESIVFYPHPFTNGGIVIAPKDDVGFIPDLISEIYQCDAPSISLYCLRRSELFQLSLTGVFGWPNPLEEKPHLAFRLKNEGVVLYGCDIRDEIRLPTDTSSFLEAHVQRCKQFTRNWALDQLRRKNHRGMINELERQTRYLMATALLSRNEWDVSLEAIPERFGRLFKNSHASQIWTDMTALTHRTDEMDEDGSRQSAFEALWLFEQFLLQMEGYTR